MQVEQCHKPPQTGNGNHTTKKKSDDWGMDYCYFTHITDVYITAFIPFLRFHLWISLGHLHLQGDYPILVLWVFHSNLHFLHVHVWLREGICSSCQIWIDNLEVYRKLEINKVWGEHIIYTIIASYNLVFSQYYISNIKMAHNKIATSYKL